MVDLDLSTEFGLRVARRLREERIIWIVTLRADLTPQPSPVWFYWDGDSLLIYSQPGKEKLRNILRNPRVALHFDGDGRGGDIVVFTGDAHLDKDAPPADKVEEYRNKYADGFARINTTAEGFAGKYSVAIRIKLSKLRGH